MTLEYYIYALLDSSKPGKFYYGDFEFDYEPFYIGKGKSDRIKNTLYDNSPFKKRKIEKLKDGGYDIISLKILENLSNSDALEKEIEIINLIGRRNLNKGPLVNLTDGGDGRLKSEHSQETKDKISKSRKGKGVGWKHSEKTLKVMSQNQSGEGNGFWNKKHTDEVKKEQSDRVSGDSHPFFGKTHSTDTIDFLKKHRKENISNQKIKESCQKFNKPVLMFDLELNFISEFESVKKASEETKINESIISKCCRGDIKKPTRYYFRYKNQEDNIKENKFLINKGDRFILNNSVVELIKRNKKTCICKINNKNKTFHQNDYPILFTKDTNNINQIELFLFLSNLDKNFKIKDDLIYNKKLKIKLLKLLPNSEVFDSNIYNDTSNVVIFEDEWIFKKDIVKSRLRNILLKSKRIFARNCQIKEVTDTKLIKEFLNDNHIQGYVRSKFKIGLFYQEELISLMTFGNLRKNLGFKSKDDSYELLRFCNKLNHNVVGAPSRLFKFFLKKYSPNYILSYSDNRWGNGNVYEKIGFKFVSKTQANYYYIIDNTRKNRFNFRKDVLVSKGYDENKTEVEIMNQIGYYRIFDKGSNKFEFYNI